MSLSPLCYKRICTEIVLVPEDNLSTGILQSLYVNVSDVRLVTGLIDTHYCEARDSGWSGDPGDPGGASAAIRWVTSSTMEKC